MKPLRSKTLDWRDSLPFWKAGPDFYRVHRRWGYSRRYALARTRMLWKYRKSA